MATEQITDLLIEALRGGARDSFQRLAATFAPDVDFESPQASGTSGVEEVLSRLQRLQEAGRYSSTLEWHAAPDRRGVLQVHATQPARAQYSSYVWDLALDAEGRVRTIRQTGVGQTEPLAPTPVLLGDDLQQVLDNAHETNQPLIVAYVDSRGRPMQSPRGTVQIITERQLGIWIWSRTGGLIGAIARNPNVSIHYWGGIGTPFGGTLLFQGAAHLDDSPQVRDLVFENSPPSEQRQDPERSGRALIIDVNRVSGFAAGFRYNMTAELSE